MVPGAWLGALADKMKLSGFEWRVVVFVVAEGPLPAYQVAKRLGLRYQHAKRAVKELRRWSILEQGQGGLTFQPDAARWDRSEVPATRPRTPPKPSKTPSAIPGIDEEVVVQ